LSDGENASQQWVLLTYTLPREPSAPRVALWRKLKKLGAVLEHDAVWILPSTPATREQVRWLAQEAREAGGEAHTWVAHSEPSEYDSQLVARFVEQSERGYRDLIQAFDDSTISRVELAGAYRRVRASDYFHAPSGDILGAKLASQNDQAGAVEHAFSRREGSA
jgi:hypothetical protein